LMVDMLFSQIPTQKAQRGQIILGFYILKIP